MKSLMMNNSMEYIVYINITVTSIFFLLVGSVIIYLLGLGSLKSFGVLYTEMLDHFSAGSGNTAWIGSITWFLLQVLGSLKFV
jgi:hypothetical protein